MGFLKVLKIELTKDVTKSEVTTKPSFDYTFENSITKPFLNSILKTYRNSIYIAHYSDSVQFISKISYSTNIVSASLKFFTIKVHLLSNIWAYCGKPADRSHLHASIASISVKKIVFISKQHKFKK